MYLVPKQLRKFTLHVTKFSFSLATFRKTFLIKLYSPRTSLSFQFPLIKIHFHRQFSIFTTNKYRNAYQIKNSRRIVISYDVRTTLYCVTNEWNNVIIGAMEQYRSSVLCVFQSEFSRKRKWTCNARIVSYARWCTRMQI